MFDFAEAFGEKDVRAFVDGIEPAKLDEWLEHFARKKEVSEKEGLLMSTIWNGLMVVASTLGELPDFIRWIKPNQFRNGQMTQLFKDMAKGPAKIPASELEKQLQRRQEARNG